MATKIARRTVLRQVEKVVAHCLRRFRCLQRIFEFFTNFFVKGFQKKTAKEHNGRALLFSCKKEDTADVNPSRKQGEKAVEEEEEVASGIISQHSRQARDDILIPASKG